MYIKEHLPLPPNLSREKRGPQVPSPSTHARVPERFRQSPSPMESGTCFPEALRQKLRLMLEDQKESWYIQLEQASYSLPASQTDLDWDSPMCPLSKACSPSPLPGTDEVPPDSILQSPAPTPPPHQVTGFPSKLQLCSSGLNMAGKMVREALADTMGRPLPRVNVGVKELGLLRNLGTGSRCPSPRIPVCTLPQTQPY